jgi:hypothetical protein
MKTVIVLLSLPGPNSRGVRHEVRQGAIAQRELVPDPLLEGLHRGRHLHLGIALGQRAARPELEGDPMQVERGSTPHAALHELLGRIIRVRAGMEPNFQSITERADKMSALAGEAILELVELERASETSTIQQNAAAERPVDDRGRPEPDGNVGNDGGYLARVTRRRRSSPGRRLRVSTPAGEKARR